MMTLEQLIKEAQQREATRIAIEEVKKAGEKAELALAAKLAGIRAFEKYRHLVPEPLHQYRRDTEAGETGSAGSHAATLQHLAKWEPDQFQFEAPGLAQIIVRFNGPGIRSIRVCGSAVGEFTNWDAAICKAAGSNDDEDDDIRCPF